MRKTYMHYNQMNKYYFEAKAVHEGGTVKITRRIMAKCERVAREIFEDYLSSEFSNIKSFVISLECIKF